MLNYSFEIVWSQVRLEFDCLINFCMTILRGGIPEHMLIIFDDFTLQKVAIDRKFPFVWVDFTMFNVAGKIMSNCTMIKLTWCVENYLIRMQIRLWFSLMYRLSFFLALFALSTYRQLSADYFTLIHMFYHTFIDIVNGKTKHKYFYAPHIFITFSTWLDNSIYFIYLVAE